jgi:hypothetical protein
VQKPALGSVKISIDPAPPVYDFSMAVGQISIIRTVRSFATVALALTEALSYRGAFGGAMMYKGVLCFVADVKPDHRAARTGNAGEGVAEAEWFLVAAVGWVP